MALVDGTNCGFLLTSPTTDPLGSNQTLDATAKAYKFTTPSTMGTVVEVGWYCDNATEAANYQFGIYSHDSGNNKPDQLLFTTGDLAKGTTAGWKTSSVSWAGLSSSTIYWLGVQLDDTATTTSNNGDSNASYHVHIKGSQTSLPSPWGTSLTDSDFIGGLYAKYSFGSPEMISTNSFIWSS